MAARMQKNAPSRFTASARRQVSSSMSVSRSTRRPIPALFTRASRRPNRSSTAANIRATAVASLTSACTATAVPPPAAMVAALASASPWRDAKLTTTAYPAAARTSAEDKRHERPPPRSPTACAPPPCPPGPPPDAGSPLEPQAQRMTAARDAVGYGGRDVSADVAEQLGVRPLQ
jgi:hypothetical protein